MLKIYIAPSKLYLQGYSIEQDNYFGEKHPFEKAAEAALAEECEKLYGKKRVKLTGKEYIDVKDVVGTNDITFEFSPIIPEGYNCGRIIEKDEKNIISKEAFLEFLEKYDKKNKKPVYTGTRFPVYMNSVSYPYVILKIRFTDNFSDSSLKKLFDTVNDFIQANNAVSDDKIHDFNIERKSETGIWLYIDFGKADPIVLQHFYEYINKLYDIERIDMG